METKETNIKVRIPVFKGKYTLPTILYFIGTLMVATGFAVSVQDIGAFLGAEGAAILIYAVIVAVSRSDHSSSSYDWPDE